MHPGKLAALVSISIAAAACGKSPKAGGDAGSSGSNTPPTIDGTRYVTVRANSSRTFQLTGQDADGDVLTFSAVGEPNHGAVSIQGSLLTYTPEADYVGPDWIEYQASDGRATSDSGFLTVEVFPAEYNVPPDALDRILVTAPGASLAIDLTAEDSDGDPLSYAIAAPPAHGALSGTGASRTYAPAAGFVGTDRFDYTADDGRGAPSRARIWITVAPAPALSAVSPAVREAAMAAMLAKTREIGGLSADETSLDSLEAVARGLAGVAMVGRCDTGLWGVFADGRSFAIVRAPEAGTTPATGLKARPSASALSTALSGSWTRYRAAVVPTGKTAILFNGYPTLSAKYGVSDPTSTLKSMLEDKGYTAQSLDATVENLRAVKGQSVVHIRTHGGNSYRFAGNLNSAQGSVFALWTSTEYSAESDLSYAADLDAGRLVYMHGDDSRTGGATDAWHYGFTKEFIAANWALNPGAYVHASACSAGSGAASAVAFRRALYNAGATRFAGWSYVTRVEDFDRGAKFVFDRLLGANTVEPKESPPQRPMDCDSVKDDMVTKGLAKSVLDSGNVSEFVFKWKQGVDPKLLTDRLAPSIENVFLADAWKEKLEIRGAFQGYDANRVEVTVGGQKAAVSSAEPDVIKADLPSGAAGDVVVSIDGRKSNRVRLCAWKGQLTYQIAGPGDLVATFTVDARLVGDVHDFRDKAGQAVKPHASYVSMDPSASKATKKASGTYSDASHRQAWSGAGPMSVQPDADASGGVAVVAGQTSASAQGQLWIALTLNDTKAWHDLVERWDDKAKTWVKDTEVDQFLSLPLAPGGLSAPSTTPIEFPRFYLKVPAAIGPDGTLLANQIGPESFASAEGSALGWTYSHSVKWNAMTPEQGTEVDADMPR